MDEFRPTITVHIQDIDVINGGKMAIDVYLQIDGIVGESTDDGHKQWIGKRSDRRSLPDDP